MSIRRHLLLIIFILGMTPIWAWGAAFASSPAVVPSPSPSAPPAVPSPVSRDLTLTQTLDLAHQQNPALKVAQFQEKEAFFAWKAAGRLPNLTASLNYVGGNNPTPTNNGQTQDYNVALNQSFGPINSVALAGEAARKTYEAAHYTTLQTGLTTDQSVKDAFYGLLAAQAQLTVAQENLALGQQIYDTAKKRFDAGAGSRLDLVNAQIQLATAQQALVQAEGALKQARTTLNPLLAWKSTEPTVAVGALELPEVHVVLETLLEEALKTHPQIMAARKSLEGSQVQVQVARSQANPTPGITYVYDLVTTPLYFIGASIQVPFDWGQIRNTVRQQVETVQEKEQALKGAVLGVDASVKSAYDSYQTAEKNASVYQSQVLQPSEEAMKMTEYGYGKGALPYVQVLTAQQNLRTARAQYITLLLTGHQAMDALGAAVGKSIEGAKP